MRIICKTLNSKIALKIEKHREKKSNMKIVKNKDSIIVYSPDDFNVVQTLECGQIFRFNIDGNTATVYSKDKRTQLFTYQDRIEIKTKDVDYFYNFFDFSTDYSKIKKELKHDKFLLDAVDYGYGIRILKNDLFEMIVSFIISANNNIGRIKKSIEYLCSHFGKQKNDYFAFPTLDELKRATVLDYKNAGLGYRAEQMFETISRLTNKDIERLKSMDETEQFKFLIDLKGVGEKVANCIMLFGIGRKDVFPVDTWINKVYNRLTNTQTTNRKLITRELTNRYGNLSGYAQQYFFYYFRDNKLS